MILMQVSITVKEDAVKDFISATMANAEGTAQEVGNVRFEILQAQDNPAQFTLIEVYADEAAMNAHFSSAHFAAWREATGDLIVESSGGKYKQVFPTD